MDNRKNTILLTVIAVATLLVAVVGATFAYFTAQGGGNTSNDIQVKTEAASSSSFSIDKNLSILANMSNFAQGTGSTQDDTMTGTVEFTAGTGTGAQTEFCYSATIAWNAATPSDFVDTGAEQEDLTLTVTKNSGWSGADYANKDVVIWSNKTVTTSADRANYTKIPTTEDGTDYKHHMTAAEGSLAKEQIKVTLSFNYSGTVDQTANAGKTLTGTLTLKEEACS